MRTEFDVIVVGGGLAGLVAGATAAAGGASVVVLEAHHPGGRARTIERRGFTFNMGAHALYRGGPGFAVLASLGITPEGTAPPLERYRGLHEGHQYLLPSGLGSLLRTSMLGWRSKAQFAMVLGRLPRLNPSKLVGTSVRGWLADQDLRPDVGAAIMALIRLSTYTADVESFGADAAVAQLQIAFRSGVVYLHGGWSQLTDRLSGQVEVRARTPVSSIEPAGGRLEITTSAMLLIARQVIVAVGTPAATRAVLPEDPGWGDPGEPVTAACLDVGARRIPDPGYVLGIDEPVYGTTQSPPARQGPPGQAVVSVVRYGARNAEDDRAQLKTHLREVGVRDEDVVVENFLARMVVAGTLPRAGSGGMRGRPGVGDSGSSGIHLAGDWVGHEGLLSDASLASGCRAAMSALGNLGLASAAVR
ncbi:MAG: FAD-dependent oxidoreductase [Acidimicrobiales bacterium]